LETSPKQPSQQRTDIAVIARTEWDDFLQAFTNRHTGWLVTIETYDLKTKETVRSRYIRLDRVEFDVEDQKNPRINVIVRDDQKEIKHILFRPSHLLQLAKEGNEHGLRIVSVNTVTSVRFRVAAAPESVDDVA
jgi:uncharacterized protein Smg (DUF494 family)